VTREPTTTALVVASVVPYPVRGGGHKRTLRLLEAIHRAGAQPYLIASETPEPGAAEALADRGIQLDAFAAATPGLGDRLRQHLARRPSPYLPEIAARLTALRARHRIAFVQFEHTQNAYYFGCAGAAPTVLSLQNVDSELMGTVARAERRPIRRLRLENRRHALRHTERRGIRLADAVLCVSEEDRASLGSTAPSVVVENGVDDSVFEIDGSIPDGERILFFGQFDYAPNSLGIHRFLREGWPIVRRERPQAQLRLAGAGMSVDLAREVRAAEGVEALGFVDSVEAELASSSVAIIPIWQGGGTRLKVLESMAAARPIAGTPLGVSGLGFEHGRHGLVAERPTDLAAGIASLLADRDLARRLGAGARELAERYRWSRVTAPAEELYRSWSEQAQSA
jgi:polysaccharide biosynthesis protein PslH